MEWAGESLILFPERALWWPKGKTLFVADVHLGKAATFRLAGIPVPEAAHHEDLLRLNDLLQRTAATHLVILGDLFHAPQGQTEETREAFRRWRKDWPELEITLVLGNHDRRITAVVAELRIRAVKGPWQLAPFTCYHEPVTGLCYPVLCGHWHPKFSLSSRGESLTAPCFYLSQQLMVLPAFGTFTGGLMIKPAENDRIFLVGPREVIALPVCR